MLFDDQRLIPGSVKFLSDERCCEKSSDGLCVGHFAFRFDGKYVITGLQIYHNYTRPHMGPNGKTPAEMAGIVVNDQNRWLTIIQNAERVQIKFEETYLIT